MRPFASLPLCLALVWTGAASGGMDGRYTKNEHRTFTSDAPDAAPILYSVRSRCKDAFAQLYCAYLDVHYADGTHDWNKEAHFRPGTHGWERAVGAFAPKKPVRAVELLGVFRDGTGEVEFADLAVERREGTNDVLETYTASDRPFSDADVIERKVFHGREVRFETERRTPSRLGPKCPLAANAVRVWTADSLRTVTPLTFPVRSDPLMISLDLARREAESAQVLVSSGSELPDVELRIGDLRRGDGTAFAGTVTWQRVGYIARALGFAPHPAAPEGSIRWLPGPLLPAAPFRVRAQSTQGTWLTVSAAADAKAGDYAGEVRVVSRGKTLATVPLAVKVWGFALPQRFGLRTAFSVMDGFTRKYYPDDFAARKRETWDLMLDHRLNPDDISRTMPPDVDDLVYARSRGMNSFNLLNVVPPARPDQTWVCYARPEQVFAPGFYDTFTNRIRPTVERIRALGMAKDAYIYGFDERDKEYFPGIDAFWRKWTADFPDIPLLTTSKQFRHYALSGETVPNVLSTDAYCPVIQHFDPDAAARLKAAGKQVWWYSCCQPYPPLPNFGSYESPLWEGRALVGWLTWRYGLDGFLFWIVNRWTDGNAKLDESDTFFPGWRDAANEINRRCPGDGTFMYPGREHVLGSVRLSMLRDAEEDYEYLKLAGADDTSPVRSLLDFPKASKPLLEARRRLADDLLREMVIQHKRKGQK